MLTASIGFGVGWAAAISACLALRWGDAAQVVSSLLRTNDPPTLSVWLRIGSSGTEALEKRPVERFDSLMLWGWEWMRFDRAIAAALSFESRSRPCI